MAKQSTDDFLSSAYNNWIKERFIFFLNNGYFFIKRGSTWRTAYHDRVVELSKISHYKPEYIYTKTSDINDYLKDAQNNSRRFLNEKMGIEYHVYDEKTKLTQEEKEKFESLLKKFSIEYISKFAIKKDLFNNYEVMFNLPLISVITNVLNGVYPNKKDNKELLKTFLDISVQQLELSKINFSSLKNYLEKREISEPEINSFLIALCKKHKNKLKDAYVAPRVRDELLKLYNNDEDKLKPYFEFFPLLAKDFIKKDLNFVKPPSKFHALLSFDIKAIMEQTVVEKWDTRKYKLAIDFFTYAIKDVYKVNKVAMVRSGDDYDVFINHDNPELTQESLQNTYYNFFRFVAKESAFELTKESVQIWVEGDKITRGLESKSQNKKIRAKI